MRWFVSGGPENNTHREEKELNDMKKRNTVALVIAGVLLLVIGLCVAFYPIFSSWYSEHTRSEVAVEYYEMVGEKANEDLSAAIESAREYNKKLFTGEVSVSSADDIENNGYYDELDIIGNGVMGYIDIPSIDVYLPIYHGLGDKEMSVGAGHMPQSSLPVGGTNTHAVISAHTGQASDPLFTNLPQMKEGDAFYVHILDTTLAYKVESIKVVEPWEIDSVKIESGRDLVTLLTCYPFPTNTDRLIVRGERIEYTPTVEDETVPMETAAEEDKSASSLWLSNWMQGIYIGVGLFLGILIIFFVVSAVLGKKKGGKNGAKK